MAQSEIMTRSQRADKKAKEVRASLGLNDKNEELRELKQAWEEATRLGKETEAEQIKKKMESFR